MRSDETWFRLLAWTHGSGESERLAARIMLHEGYSRLDPSHPLGGPDGGKDAVMWRGDQKWIMAVYFPRDKQTYSEIQAKLVSDAAGVVANDAYGIVFVCNQELTLADRDRLKARVGVPCELYHLERLAAILDQPALVDLRRQYLYIDFGSTGPRTVFVYPISGAEDFDRRLIGRDTELDALTASLNSEGPGGVVVSGMPGVGKTSLARAAAVCGRRAGRFPGGAFLIDFKGYESDGSRPVESHQAVSSLVLALGGENASGDPAENYFLLHWLLDDRKQGGQQVLLVFDNVAEAKQITNLTPVGPGHKFVVTSRHAIASQLADHAHLPLRPLTKAASIELLLRGTAWSEHVHDDGLVKLAQLCGGLPVALQVVREILVNEPQTSPVELAGELASEATRLAALQYMDSGPRAVFRGSYQRLSGEDARILRYMSLHPGRTHTVTSTATLAGIDPGDTRSALRRLQAAHLIDVGLDHGTWILHDLLRLYAREVAAIDDSDSDRKAALSRLFVHYFTNLQEVNFWINGRQSPDQPSRLLTSVAEALAWAQTEAANAVACVSAAADMDALPQAWDLAIALNPYLDTSGDHATALAMSRLAVDIATAQGDLVNRADALNNVGHGLNKAGLYTDAKAAFMEARTAFHRMGDKEGEARVLTGLSEAMRGEGDADATISFLRRAVRLYRQCGAADDIGYALTNLGTSLRDIRSYAEARRVFDLAVAAHRASGARRPEAQTLVLMATVVAQDGDTDRAVTCLNAALEIARELHDTQLQGMTVMNLGSIHLQQEKPREAELLFLDAINLFRDAGDSRHAAEAYINMVVLNRHLGRAAQVALYIAELDKLGAAATDARRRWARQRAV